MANEVTRLDDILALAEPERTHAIRAWINEGDVYGLDAKLVPASGKSFRYPAHGKMQTIPPKGKRFPRRKAIDILLDYGAKGKYLDMDIATGVKRNKVNTLPPGMKAMFEGYEFQFVTDHLTHVPDAAGDDEGSEE